MDALTITVKVLFYLTYALSSVFAIKYFMHIFQNNSYNPKAQLFWIKENLNVILPRALISMATIILLVLSGEAGLILSGIIYIVLAYFYKPKVELEPISYTKEIKLISGGMGIFMAAVLVLSILSIRNTVLFAFIVTAGYITIPFFVILMGVIFRVSQAKK